MLELTDLRIRLNQMNERIVSRLKDRSRFSLNGVIYVPDAITIEGRSGISFLDFALEGLEVYHASLGRYDYPDQYPVFSRILPKSPVKREMPSSYISKVDINLRDELIRFYVSILSELCLPGDNSISYGETAYLDADILQHLQERINVGRYVAESKLQANTQIQNIVADKTLLTVQLKDAKREEDVINQAKETAFKYELNPELVGRVFRWIIDETLKVEIDYLQKKLLRA